jgi:hypothetical protein
MCCFESRLPGGRRRGTDRHHRSQTMIEPHRPCPHLMQLPHPLLTPGRRSLSDRPHVDCARARVHACGGRLIAQRSVQRLAHHRAVLAVRRGLLPSHLQVHSGGDALCAPTLIRTRTPTPTPTRSPTRTGTHPPAEGYGGAACADCKLLSPARAMEWIYLDGLRSSLSLAASKRRGE